MITAELRYDLSRIFRLFIENGADTCYIAPNAFEKTYKEQYAREAVGEFL